MSSLPVLAPRSSARSARLATLLATLPALVTCAAPPRAGPEPRPDIVLVVADDLGFSDLGCTGGEIATPVLDALAREGVLFTRFATQPRCCPSRASLLTGRHPHAVDMGWMAHDVGVDGYRGTLDPAVPTIAERLRDAGYGTAMVGKWHLGASPTDGGAPLGRPRERGFDRFFGMLGGAGSHHDPPYLLLDDTPVAPTTGFHATTAYVDRALAFVDGHLARRPDDPLFLYVSLSAPHWPMHASDEDIARYRGRYDAGWDVLREARRVRQVDAGVVDPAWGLAPRPPDVPAWDDVPDPRWQASRMEVYAAMVDRMDRELGRLVEHLRARGRLERTLFVFLSDNGPSAEENSSLGPVRPARPPPTPLRLADARAPQTRIRPALTRAGEPVRTGYGVPPGPESSFVAVGRGWASLSATPFRGSKSRLYEGGVAVPLVVHWPAGTVRAGSLDRTPCDLLDLFATFVDAADAGAPDDEGTSLLPALRGEPVDAGPSYWEHEGRRAVRLGDRVLVADGESAPWELYDLAADRTQRHDLAASRPDEVETLAAAWQAWAERNDVLPLTPYRRLPMPVFSTARRFRLAEGATLGREASPDLRGAAFRARVEVLSGDGDGVLVAQGGDANGWSLSVERGRPAFAVRRDEELVLVRATSPVAAPFTVEASLAADGAVVLRVVAARVLEELVDEAGGTIPAMPVEGLQVGRDDGVPVLGESAPPPWPGRLRVEVELR